MLAYGLSFAQQFIDTDRPVEAALLLEAYSRGRQEAGLGEDRHALQLRPQVLSAQAETKRREWKQLEAKGASVTRREVGQAEQAYRDSCSALRTAQAALADYEQPAALALSVRPAPRLLRGRRPLPPHPTSCSAPCRSACWVCLRS